MSKQRGKAERLGRQQSSVVSRAQLLEMGIDRKWITRQVVSKRWQRVYEGVYLVHTGPPNWSSRVMAALLYAGRDAALSHTSASAFWHESASARERLIGEDVEISIPFGRTVVRQRGLVIHRRRSMPKTDNFRPPVTSAAETAVDLVDRVPHGRVDDVVGILTRATRLIDATALRAAIGGRKRLRHRHLALDILADVDEGVESPLEYRYHGGVETAHGLPVAELQVREKLDDHRVRADCRYRKYRVRVELDGQLAHPGGRTDRDTWRDNAAVLETEELTLRYRWRHVVGSPCTTAAQVAQALRRGGWTGTPRRCGPGCALP